MKRCTLFRKNRIICRLFVAVLLILALSAALSLSVYADSGDSAIKFEGGAEAYIFLEDSDWTDSDLFGNFKNLMPGDHVVQEISVGNISAEFDYANIYMKVLPHDETENPLSPLPGQMETLVTMTDFLDQLSMKIYNAGELIYDASPNEAADLQDYILLGSFKPGESTTVTVELTVPAELGNEYAYRVGEVDWTFYAEGIVNGQPVPVRPSDPVVLGVETSTGIYLAGLIAAAVLLLYLLCRMKRTEP